jgi:hypothetical protein
MGYLTTITFYNDEFGEFEKDKVKLAKKVLDCMQDSGRRIIAPVGMIPQRPIHSSEQAIYVQAGGTVLKMNYFSEETEKLLEQFPDFFNEIVKNMEYQAKELRKMYKERHKEKQ